MGRFFSITFTSAMKMLGHSRSSELDDCGSRLYGTSTESKIFCTTVSAVTSSASAS